MKSRIYIEAFDCVTSTGENPESFWKALDCGQSGILKTNISSWPARFQEYWADQNHAPISCTIKKDQTLSAVEFLSNSLSTRALNVLKNIDHDSIGIIFSSTKGAVEDFVWKSDFSAEVDPLNLVLEETMKKIPGINWKLSQVVSNSCASSHAAMALGKKWIQGKACDKVLIIAGDVIGPFIHSGFQTLKALSVVGAKPFQENRDGLVLGEALTAILLSNKSSEFELVDCQIFNEAHTVTGASPEGRGLYECINRLDRDDLKPDFIIAHGTATILNDQIEDHVLARVQADMGVPILATGTKWSIGHTLGASGSIDLIAAMMSLKNQKVFSLHADSGQSMDQFKFKNYVYKNSDNKKIQSALITSLGFGGTNGALMVRRHEL